MTEMETSVTDVVILYLPSSRSVGDFKGEPWLGLMWRGQKPCIAERVSCVRHALILISEHFLGSKTRLRYTVSPLPTLASLYSRFPLPEARVGLRNDTIIIASSTTTSRTIPGNLLQVITLTP